MEIAIFFALFSSQKLGFEALVICLFHLAFVFVYLIFYQKEKLYKD
jgi:cytochrome c oxidase cbb3-type subunit I